MSLMNQNRKQQLDIKIRDFEQNDYPEIAKINNAVFPDMPITGEEYLERDQNRNKKCKHRRWVAIVDDRVVGVGLYSQQIYQYHPHKFNIWVIVLPDYQNIGIGSRLFKQINESLKQFDPISINTAIRDDMNSSIQFIKAKGFEEYQRYTEPHLEVDSFDFTPYDTLESNLNSNGIKIKTIRELENDPERNSKIYELSQEIAQDLPDEDEFTRVDFDTFEKESIKASYTVPDAYFIAIDGDKYIGLSILMKFKADKNLYTDLTGIRRPYRRRGIATCLKVKAIEYAKQQQCSRIKTDNQSGNQPMLNLNNKLGFKQRFNWICYKKVLRNHGKKR